MQRPIRPLKDLESVLGVPGSEQSATTLCAICLDTAGEEGLRTLQCILAEAMQNLVRSIRSALYQEVTFECQFSESFDGCGSIRFKADCVGHLRQSRLPLGMYQGSRP